ncbi:MAG: ABC transporter permease [Armatimonadota bacterium]|nr:ABC transporter permease [Armatimonadota bacterium]
MQAAIGGSDEISSFGWERVRRLGRWLSTPSAGFLLLVVSASILAAVVAPHDPLEMSKATPLSAPSTQFPLGTDQFGRDILSRLLFGARIALLIGIGSTLTAAAVGVPLGLWAGYAGGRVDAVVMRVVDTLLAIPPVLLAMALVAMTGRSSVNAAVAVAVVALPQFARIARAGTLSEKSLEYVEAAVAVGASDTRLVFRTILPNVLSPVLVQIPIGVSRAILLEASLSFLGLGTQPPQPSWGLMIRESRDYMYTAPLYGVFPGAVIALTVLSLNALSDRARAAWRS